MGDIPFNGRIDELAVYDSELSSSTVQNHYDTGLSAGGQAEMDFEDSNIFTLAVPNFGITLANPTNKAPGRWYLFATAASGGSSSISFDTDYNVVSGSFDGTANTVNILELVSDGTDIDVFISQRP